MRNLLVTGRPGTGKTTVVEGIAEKFARDGGGFLTGEIRQKGVRKGFQIVTLEGRRGILAHVSIESPLRIGRYGTDVGAIEAVAVPAVRSALEQKKIVIIDEIGRMELASEAFRRCVLDALGSGRIVVATIQKHSQPFTDAIKGRGDVRVFQLTAGNRSAVQEEIREIVEQLLAASGNEGLQDDGSSGNVPG